MATCVLLASLSLPLLGRIVGPGSLAHIWEFPPPLVVPQLYDRFSWGAVIAILAALVVILLPWTGLAPRKEAPDRQPDGWFVPYGMPVWGWFAVAWTVLWWLIAWTHWRPLSFIQPHTFFPLWLGFIATVSALTVWRSGDCLLLREPRKMLLLFALSAAFWWAFEWLNRFVENWHYLGVQKFGPIRYFLHATLCFGTVLPAVLAVREHLATFPNFQRLFGGGPILPFLDHPLTAWLLVLAGAAGLFFAGFAPESAYPAVWAGPLFIFWGLRNLTSDSGMLCEMAAGEWRRPVSWGLAALVCGFFWELWNFYSLPRWIYTVPHVEFAHIFEMPLLGYLGYLPFGIVCGLVVEAAVGEG